MGRRFDFHVPEDNPEIVKAERLEAIAADLERIAESLENLEDDEDSVL